MDEDRIMLGCWLGLVTCVSFSALTLTVGLHERHPAHKMPHSINTQRISSATGGGKNLRVELCG